MILFPVAGVEREFSFWDFAHEQLFAYLQFVQRRRERPIGNQFQKELDFIFRGGGCDGVRALDALAVDFHRQAGILARYKIEFAVGCESAESRDRARHRRAW